MSMKDFQERLKQFGYWYKPSGKGKHDITTERFVMTTPSDRQKPRCAGEYPYCDTAMNIHFHTITNSRAQPGSIRLQCKICGKGGIVDAHQWRVDVAKSKKSE